MSSKGSTVSCSTSKTLRSHFLSFRCPIKQFKSIKLLICIHLTESHSIIRRILLLFGITNVFALVSLQQHFQSLTAPQSTTDWLRVKLQTDNNIGTARKSFATLAALCHCFENQLCAEGLQLLLSCVLANIPKIRK